MPMSKASPAAAASRRRASASRPSTAVDARMPQPSACRCSPVRLMAESSTISTRSPLRSLAGGSAAGIGASGSCSSNQNVEPAPGVLSTPIRPPISSTRRLEIARPRPVPPYWRVVEASAWVNSVNSRARVCLARCRCRCRPPRSAAAASVSSRRAGHLDQRPRPRSVNLMALPTRLSRIWRRRPGSPTHVPRQRPDRCGRTSSSPLASRRSAAAGR